MLRFWIKEAFKGIRRTKSSFFISLVSTTVAVLLLILSIVVVALSDQFQTRIKESLTISLFLKEGIDDNKLNEIKSEINNNTYIRSTTFISKDDAAKIFINETGEDFKYLLDFNPLPASFVITLNDDYINELSINKIIADFKLVDGVDEVVFKQDLTHSVLNILNNIKKYVFLITIVLLLLSVYIVYSTTKLIILSKHEEIETMKLVGAKLSTIKAPIILNALIIGVMATVFSILLSVFLYQYLSGKIALELLNSRYTLYLFAAVVLAGPFLAVMVSSFALRKVSLKI